MKHKHNLHSEGSELIKLGIGLAIVSSVLKK